jgi:hypothetical protein
VIPRHCCKSPDAITAFVTGGADMEPLEVWVTDEVFDVAGG